VKYARRGSFNAKRWYALSESERHALMEECFAYDGVLRQIGHFVRGEALQAPQNAITLKYWTGKLFATEGPYVETKEQLGGS
jgi:hypothetical protein